MWIEFIQLSLAVLVALPCCALMALRHFTH